MDKVAGIVHACLEQDRQRPPKECHTAQRIHERLRDEHGFKGSASTVRRYVYQLRSALLEEYLRGLLELQAVAFEACESTDTTIDKRSLVTVATNSYPAPTR